MSDRLPIGLLIVAALASVATSPGVPGIEDEASGTIVLTSEAPVATFDVVLRLSPTAYDPAPEEPGTLAVGVTAARDAIPPPSNAVPVEISFRDRDGPLRDTGLHISECSTELPPPRLREICDTARYVHPFRECRRREPCEVGLTVELRWTNPPRGSRLEIEWDITAWLRYAVKSGVPPGATLELEVKSR